MKIMIEIPKEFECDYAKDKFEDFFQRVLSDIKTFNHHQYDNSCGNYEKEIAEMFIKAFQESDVK